jgi:hypothetical protein
MSDSILVFVRCEKLPSVNQLRLTLSALGLELKTWEKEKLEEIEGFWPGSYKGEEAGFEFYVGQVEDEDLENWDVDRQELEECDYVVELCFYTEMDVLAATLCASALCKACDGLTFDNDEELSINSSNCEVWANRVISELDPRWN